LALIAAALSLVVVTCDGALAQKPILSGPLAKLDIKPAQLEPGKGKPKGTSPSRSTSASTPAGWIPRSTCTR
jgi:hypothetical protein